MGENPTLTKLGYVSSDRVVIIHADDLGMCHAANVAFEEMVAFGWVRCGSVMVPCPWFLELAKFSVEHPAADVGVHLTLNSEWQSYRWPPISTRDPASGLIDEQGIDPALAGSILEQYGKLEAAGIPLVDHMVALPLDHSQDLLAQYKASFEAMKPGLTHFVVHPCAPGFDMEAISQSAADRISDNQMLVSEELRDFVDESGIKVIGYRELRNLMRGGG